MPKLDKPAQKARREHILDAAERCFIQQGFHSASMQDICREASISPGAFYLYFSSKDDLIIGICERERTALVNELASIADAPDFMVALSQLGESYCLGEPHEKLRLQLEINAEAMHNPHVGQTVRDLDTFVLDSFERVLQDARAKGRINPTLDVSIIAQIVAMLGDGLYLRRALHSDFDGAACMPVILSLIASLINPVDNDDLNFSNP